MADDRNPLRRLSKTSRQTTPPSRFPGEPIEEAYEAAADARDIIRDKQRRDLPSYHGDEDEITANVHVTVNMPQPTPSQPDLKVETETAVEIHGVKVTGLPKWAGAVIALLVAVSVAVVAALLAK